MSETFLSKILASTREKVELQRRTLDFDRLKRRARSVRAQSENHRLRSALTQNDKTNIIAEIKRASPSKGLINEKIDVAETARSYEMGGACGISVLTEVQFFRGSMEDLRSVRSAVKLPILRKDFIVDEIQILEAAGVGADAILLIVAALSSETLRNFLRLIEDELGMDALVEVHTRQELEIARGVAATIIGVNNRDLHSLHVSLDVSRELIAPKPQGTLMVAESGIVSRDDILELKSFGFDGFLVGETLMRAENPRKKLEEWVR